MRADAPSEPVAVPSEEKPFRLPSLSQFAASQITASPDETTVYAPTSAVAATDAPDETDAPNVAAVADIEAPVDATVFAPSPAPERQVVARTEPQTGAVQDLVSTIESLPGAEIPREIAPESARLETPVGAAATGENTPTAAAPASAPEAEVVPASPAEERPVTRSANGSNLTPFQRLMAARAAQSGPPIPRPRPERSAPVPIAAPVETPDAEAAPETEVAPLVEAPIAQQSRDAIALPTVSDEETAPIEAPEVEAPALDAPSLPEVETPAAAFAQAPASMPSEGESSSDEATPDAPTAEFASETEIVMPDAQTPPEMVPETEMAPVELPEAESQAQSPQVEAAAAEISTAEVPEVMPEVEMPDSSTGELESVNDEAAESAATTDFAEAETVPEERVAANENLVQTPAMDESSEPESPASEAPESEAPASETSEAETPASEMPVARPALSLADRLARAPRAELDAAHAEAQALTPEILGESATRESADAVPTDVTSAEASAEDAPDLRRAVPVSFAERLAARTRTQSELPEPTSAATAPHEENAATSQAAPDDENVALSPTMNSAPLAPTPAPEPPRRAIPRTFSERLAARTSLDRHLQVPAEESAPTSSDLATSHTELARIDEGAHLSEREMKNRVLFRQKHLIFDSVIGSVDARLLQNPTRETVKAPIERGVDGALREFGLELEPFERNWMVDEFVREVTDLGALVPMLEDPSVSKIVVTGANDVSVERLGRIERSGVSFRDDDHLLNLVRRIAEMSGGRVDAKVPLLDRPLPDGGRIRAKVPPLAPQPTLTIEKSTGNPFVVLKRQMDEKSRGDSLPYAQLRERIQQKLLREFEGDAASLAGDQDKLRLQVEEMIGQVIAEERVAVTRAERASLVMDLLNEIVGLGPIEPLLNDPDVDEVMVNGPYQIYVERKGKLELTSQRFRDNGHVMQVIDRIVAPLGRRVDEKSPMVDGRLRDGSRFNAIIPPLALSGPTMTIRKFARDPFTMSDLINFGSLTREAAQFLQAAVEGRLNVVVSGGTGSGKTTTLNVLSSFIPSTERIVTIEDAAELQMRQEHVIRMETRPPNIEGVGEIGIRDLVRNSLRMRPDRIVVGECRGGEALDMLQAMNTGHDGSLTTAHSNGPRDTCKRLETMVMMAGFDLPVRAIREQISMAVQLIVHQERMRDGKRRVTAITEIVGMEGDVLTLQDIFRFEQEGMDDDGRILGALQATGMRPKYYETIIDNGVQLSMDLFTPKPHEAAPRARMQERGGR